MEKKVLIELAGAKLDKLGISYEKVPDTYGVLNKITLTCSKHGDFKTRHDLVLNGRDICPKCQTINHNERCKKAFIDKSKRRFGDLFSYDKLVYKSNAKRVTLTCKKHGDFVALPCMHLKSDYGCPGCKEDSLVTYNTNLFFERVVALHGDKYDYTGIIVRRWTDRININCPKHGTFTQEAYVHAIKGTDCPECARDKYRYSANRDLFIQKANEVFGKGRFDYSLIKLENESSYIDVICPEHGIFNIRASSHLEGYGCKKCNREGRIEVHWEQFKKFLELKFKDSLDFSNYVYKDTHTKSEVICPKHGVSYRSPNQLRDGIGCSKCKISLGELLVSRLLESNGIPYEREFSFENSRFRFDFRILNLNILIEFHGGQHFIPVPRFGGKKALKKIQERDYLKKGLAYENGFKLIELTYIHLRDKVLEKTLIRKLKEIYPLWIKIDNEIKVFRNLDEIYSTFNIPDNLNLVYLEDYIETNHPNVKILLSEKPIGYKSGCPL